MKTMIRKPLTFLLAAIGLATTLGASAQQIPHLKKHGTATHLVVDGKPLLILGGELGNSTASDLKYLERQWPVLKTIGINTVLAPVEWDQIEPTRGVYDFKPLEGVIRQAEANQMKVVLLWFGAWKNSTSSYTPPYIKHGPSVRTPAGRSKVARSTAGTNGRFATDTRVA